MIFLDTDIQKQNPFFLLSSAKRNHCLQSWLPEGNVSDLSLVSFSQTCTRLLATQRMASVCTSAMG